MIDVRGLTVLAGSFALRDLALRVPAGSYAVLMGRTGSGKTTLIETVCGLRRVSAGTIELSGRCVTHAPPADRGVGYVPQDRALFTTMTVRENLAFPLRVRRWRRADAERRVAELAEQLGLAGLLARTPAGLSGGEAQRVALGRALAARPGVLLLDEPLSALDDRTRAAMHELLKDLRRRTPVTTLHVTHDPEDAGQLADEVLVLEDGAVRPAGEGQRLLAPRGEGALP